MKRTLLRRGLLLAGAAAAIGGTVMATAPAGAVIPPPGVNVIAAGGSDTTEAFMQAYLNGRTSSTDSGTTYVVSTRNIPALAPAGQTTVVPGDADCPNGTITFGPAANAGTAAGTQYTSTSATTYPTPNGSSAGRRFLVDQRIADPDAACLDIARSSSTPGIAGETSSAQYYAFALDAITWATQSSYAPATLTAAQIDGIYACQFNNWNQVGGSDMPIQRLMANAGSGSRAFFMSTFGITDAELAINTGPNGTCPATLQTGLQENEGTVIPRAHRETGIIGYSAGRWAYQANNAGNPTVDLRAGIRLGGYTTGAATPVRGLPIEFLPGDNAYQLDTISDPGRPATVGESNIGLANPAFNATTDFRGIRYLFNVIDANSPSFLPSRGLVGFNNVPGGSLSPLCNPANGAGDALADFGFARLNTDNPVGSNAAGSTCRRFLGTG